MIDIQTIRNDFPQLDGENNHYLDSAATSLTPTPVLDAVNDYYMHSRANVHRGLFPEAIRATELYEEARKKVAHFINADPDEIIFTSGATESSNMLVRMLEESNIGTSDVQNIVTSEMEHHGALVPLQQLAKRSALTLTYIPLSEYALDYTKVSELITNKTALVSVMLASNVLGTVNDIAELSHKAHEHGALMIVDGTAAMGHIPVDVEALGCDAFYFSGHKMFAPTGVGVLWVKKSLLEKLSPSTYGGHSISRVEKEESVWAEIPARFEPGTKDIGGVIGLGAAVDYIEHIGIEQIRAHVEELVAYTILSLESIPGVRVFAEYDIEQNVGVVSFVCEWAHAHDVAEILARDRVAVRPGHHCAMPLHTVLGVEATTRASFHVYNTKEDVQALISGIEKAHAIFS